LLGSRKAHRHSHNTSREQSSVKVRACELYSYTDYSHLAECPGKLKSRRCPYLFFNPAVAVKLEIQTLPSVVLVPSGTMLLFVLDTVIGTRWDQAREAATIC
jgi:hypothetical protein